MLLSRLVSKTSKETSRSDVSVNAQLLARAGYVDRLMAGVYSYLPLGLRVLHNIERIIREEMDALGGQEVLLPALHPKEIWERTGRWDSVDVLYKLSGHRGAEPDLALGPTHEEVAAPLVSRFVQSYRDLPVAVYQLQTKFRNEPRARSGILRGREFRMKDMYSFHADQRDLDDFYERATAAYARIYQRCGLGELTLLTYASGGSFSTYSHEFQTVTPFGEDVVYRIPGTKTAINKEIVGDERALREILTDYQPGSEHGLEELKAIEVGNIFKLGSRFTDAVGASFSDATGASRSVLMGCYGIGPSRVMGTIAECLSDDKGLRWPVEVAPYQVYLIALGRSPTEQEQGARLYQQLTAAGIPTLFDDRSELRAGERLSDSELLGIPHRLVLGPKSLAQGGIEHKSRFEETSQVLPLDGLVAALQSLLRPRQ
jgi:prolyl-tRNA synthetase